MAGDVIQDMLSGQAIDDAMKAERSAQINRERLSSAVRPIDEVGDYLAEADDPNVLVYGPWLERGGSAFWVSTTGTGKSVGCMQLVHCFAEGLPFCGLRPRGKIRSWIFQSEDSPRRVAQDRIDVRAELAEKYPDVDWAKAGESVKLVKLTGAVGASFLAELDTLLTTAKEVGEMPDLIVLNPFLAFVGGPITDGNYVTPFLRGGTINGQHTVGLQAILERHSVGVLIFHHTPKPPSEKEIDGWMKSAFPEYQGAGSSDITNWGRSFVTMMRVKDHPTMVCVTAGKNGGELGWERVGGAYRRYMAFSDEIGVSGKGRHAWRDLTPDEYAEVVGTEQRDEERQLADAIAALVTEIKAAPVAPLTGVIALSALMAGKGIAKGILRRAISTVVASPETYHLTVQPILHGNKRHERHIGLSASLEAAKKQEAMQAKYEEAMHQ